MLILEKDQIERLIQAQDLIAAMENAFLAQASGNFQMPDRMHIQYEENTHLLMPCMADGRYAIKTVSVNPANKALEMPVIHGLVQLIDERTGELLALMDGGTVTALRTGTVGALGAKYLSSPQTDVFGLIGCGRQGLHLARMITAVRNIKKVVLYDRRPESALRFQKSLEKLVPRLEYQIVSSSAELLKSADLIVAATTASRPVFPDKPELLAGKCFVGIGSFTPDMQEFPDSLFSLLEQYFIDVELAKKESGDVANPLKNGWLAEDRVLPLNKIISGEVKAKGETRAFKSVGMALFDLFAANMIYEAAQKQGVGTKVEL